MIFEELYRDIVSLFKEEGLDYSGIFATDIVHAINDSISAQRIQQVRSGIKSPFSISKSILFSIEDRNVPYLNRAGLDTPALQELNLDDVILTAYVNKTSKQLRAVSSWNKGDVAIYEGVLYKAVADGAEAFAEQLIYDSAVLKAYKKEQEYDADDILLHAPSDRVYRVDGGFVADENVENEPLTQLFWRKVERSGIDASIIPYEHKRDLKVLDKTITTNGKDLFASTDIGSIYIEYIPEWTFLSVDDFEQEMDLPNSIIQMVKQDVFQRLAPKLRTSQEQTNE